MTASRSYTDLLMAKPSVCITAQHQPTLDELLELDCAYHLGSRDQYSYDVRNTILNSKSELNEVFICINISNNEILVNKTLKGMYRLDSKSMIYDGTLVVPQLDRTINTINRTLPLLNENLYYAYDLWDARRTDYTEFFGTEKSIPVIQYHRLKKLNAIIIPVWNYHNYPSWNIPFVNDSKQFSKKRPKAFWRGSLTGTQVIDERTVWISQIISDENMTASEKDKKLNYFGRYFVCKNHVNDPRVDAKFIYSNDTQHISRGIDYLQRIFGERADISEQLDYKYLLALDGFDGPSNMYWIFRTNSLLLRQESEWQMFADCYFLPWVHYVPIANSCDDISDKLDWCEKNPSRCEAMINNAKATWNIIFNSEYTNIREKHSFSTLNSWMLG